MSENLQAKLGYKVLRPLPRLPAKNLKSDPDKSTETRHNPEKAILDLGHIPIA